MFWIIFISLLVFLFIWLLAAPVIIYLDTVAGRYAVSMPGIFTARAVSDDRLFHIRGRILFIPYRFNPFRNRKKRPEREGRKKPAGKKKRRRMRGGLKMGRDLFGSVRINRFHLDVDTEDVVLNAWLIPVFSMLNTDRIRMTANFEGRVNLLMDLRTRLGSLAWVFIRNQFRRK